MVEYVKCLKCFFSNTFLGLGVFGIFWHWSQTAIILTPYTVMSDLKKEEHNKLGQTNTLDHVPPDWINNLIEPEEAHVSEKWDWVLLKLLPVTLYHL